MGRELERTGVGGQAGAGIGAGPLGVGGDRVAPRAEGQRGGRPVPSPVSRGFPVSSAEWTRIPPGPGRVHVIGATAFVPHAPFRRDTPAARPRQLVSRRTPMTVTGILT